MFNCDFFNLTAQEINNCLIFANLVLTSAITIGIQLLARHERHKNFLDGQLFNIQKLSFENPYVENKKYTNRWEELKDKYEKNELEGKELDDFLKYDVYTEMIFNFVEMSLNFYKSEKRLLKYVEFKKWIRNHEQNWKKPLEAHINHEAYNEKTCAIIDKWLK